MISLTLYQGVLLIGYLKLETWLEILEILLRTL